MDINVFDGITITEDVTTYLDKLFIAGFGGCYAHYSLNELSGVIVSDTSGNARNGTTVGAPSWVAGKLNNCLQLNGATQYVDFGEIANFERTQACTFEFWIKTSTTPIVSAVVLGKVNNTSYRGHEVFIGNLNTINFALINALSNYLHVRGSIIVTNNVWHYVVITYNGNSASSGVQIYIDNVLEVLTILKDNLAGTILTSETFKIGKDDTTGAYYTGLIDEAVVYDRVISAGERSGRWNGGAGTEVIPSSGIFDSITITEVVTNSLAILCISIASSIEIIESLGIVDYPLNIGPVLDYITIAEPTFLSPDPLYIDLYDTITINSTNVSLVSAMNAVATEDITIDDAAFLYVPINIPAGQEDITVTDAIVVSLPINIDVGDTMAVQEAITFVLPQVVMFAFEDITITDIVTGVGLNRLYIYVQELDISIFEVFGVGNLLSLGPVTDIIFTTDLFNTVQIDALFIMNIIQMVSITETVVITPDLLHISVASNIFITEVLAEQETIEIFFAEDIVISEAVSVENPLVHLTVAETITTTEAILPELLCYISTFDSIWISESVNVVPDILYIFVVEDITITEDLVDQEVMELLISDTITITEYIALPEVIIGINEFEDIQFDDVVVSGPLIETLSLLVDLTPVSRVQRVIDLIRDI